MSGWLSVVSLVSLGLALVLMAAAVCSGSRRMHKLVNSAPLPSQQTIREVSTCAQMAALSVMALMVIAVVAVAIGLAVR